MSQCVVIGNESLAIACAEVLRHAGHDIVAFVADHGTPAERARRAGLPVCALADLPRHAPQGVDFLFSITNLRVLPPPVLALARRGAINYHDGPLPRYAGLNAPVFALLAGEPRHGITWHLMTDRVDAGGILRQARFEVSEHDTALTLNTRCYEAALASFEDLVASLPHLEATEAAPLDPDTTCPKGRRPTGGAVIDWHRPARDIVRLVRALDHGGYANPVAAVTTWCGAGTLIVAAAEPGIGPAAEPGTVVKADATGLLVATAEGHVRLTRILTADGTPVDEASLARLGVTAGTLLPSPDEPTSARLDATHRAVGRHEEWWLERLAEVRPLELPGVVRQEAPPAPVPLPVAVPTDAGTTRLVAATLAWLARSLGRSAVEVGLTHGALERLRAGVERWFAPLVPLGGIADDMVAFEAFERDVAASLARTMARGTWAVDAPSRRAGLRQAPAPRFDVVIRLDADQPFADAVLTICLADGRVTWWHDATRLPADNAARLAAQFTTLLAAAHAEPARAIGDLPVIPPDEHALLQRWNSTTTAWPSECTIPELLAEQVARTPDTVAAIFDGVPLTYGELDRRANRLARHLRAAGVGPDVIVGLHLRRSLDLLVGLLGILKAGGAYLPLDPAYPADRLAFMLEDAGVPVVVTEEATRDRLPETGATVVALDGHREQIATHSADPVAPCARPEHLAYVIYTSGSTGKPKGVMLEHRNAVNFFTAMDDRIGRGPGTWLAVTSLSFDISVLELLWTLARGFTVVIYREEDRRMPGEAARPADAWSVPALIRRHGVTHLQCTPSLITMLLQEEGAPDALRGLQRLLVGGEALPATLATQLATLVEGELHNMYGPTETTVWSTSHLVHPDTGTPPLGRPVANTQVYVLDGRRRPMPLGSPGELYIGGAGVARGYLHRAALTAERFVPDPFTGGAARLYRTGDLARFRPDGVLEFLGRVDFQVKLRGHRIELGEIEHLLREMTGVREAVAIAREDVPGDLRLVAYVVPHSQGDLEAATLRERLKELLPDYMVPSAVVVLEALPLTPNLKVDRKALPRPVEAALASESAAPPRPGVETAIADAWCEALKRTSLGREMNVFDVGAHSLLAMQVHRRLRARFPDHPLTVTDLFRFPTVAALAPLLGGAPAEGVPRAASHTHRAEPTWFGDSARPLFGMYHTARAPRRGAVLMCYPLPPKYQLCYSVFRRLAMGLAELGYDVLRFDYSGLGDSFGEPCDATLDRWSRDVALAMTHLRARSGAASLSLVGMRIGAALAARVGTPSAEIDRLVLWEPVLHGATYLHELRDLSRIANPRRPDDGALDLFGFGVSDEFQRQLQDFSLLDAPPSARRALLLESKERPESVVLRTRLHSLEHACLPGLENWRTAYENDQVIIPTEHVQCILRFMSST